MTQTTALHNPFMLMINPEVVFAAMEKSERLSQLDRHLCRPLDRITPVGATTDAATDAAADDDEDADAIGDPLA